MTNASEQIETVMTAEERAVVGGLVSRFCRPHAVVEAERLAAFVAARQMSFLSRGRDGFALAAGPSAPAKTVVCAPDEEVRFAFVSAGEIEADRKWTASLTVPPKADAETMLTLLVRDAAGAACAGVFRLSGVSLPLEEGRAKIPFGTFLAGVKDADVSLCRPGDEPVGGTLAFFV